VKSRFIFYLLLFVSFFGSAQSTLTLEEIMKGDAFVGNQPENPRWSIDGQTIYFEWNPKNELGTSTYFWKTGMAEPRLLPISEINASKNKYLSSKDKSVYYFIQKGALYGLNKKTNQVKKLFQNSNPIANLTIGIEPGTLFFQQNGNIFKMNTNEGSLLQITNLTKGKARDKIKETDTFLKQQQKELFQYVRDQESKKKWNDERSKWAKSDFPKPFYLDKNEVQSFYVNPNGDYITYLLQEQTETKNENMEVFVTADGYNLSKDTKDKVSVTNLTPTKLGIFNVKKDTTYYVDFSKLTAIKKQPDYYNLYDNLKKLEPKERPVYVIQTVFSEDGKWTVADIRSQDNKDRWIVNINSQDGTFKEIDHQHDEAWIAGPGIPDYSFPDETIHFLGDNQTIYYQSEATGFSHLYSYNLVTNSKKQLTSGNWEVRKVELSNDKQTFYLTTNTTHPGNRDFYKLPVQGGSMTALLTKEGFNDVYISPDEKTLLVRYSFKNKPWDLYVMENKPNAKWNQITYSTSEAYKKYNWRAPEVITFKAEDGKNVNARIYVPETNVKNNAAILFVHGAGYLQNAHNYWSSYLREYMFHNLLTDLGYTVLDIDYRASEGYGRDHRTGIYRFMGGKDLSDQIDGKKLLVEKYGVDANKVGIYGGSYGGFITLMAMLTKPKEFKAGCALRSVTDWAHYNQGYTGNILNFPETDPEAYKKSSPIYYADKLEGNLLMLHGMVDDNVEYKDIVRISQRFIELGKKNWSLASYPIEAHGFKETYSWIDEYSRILEHFNTYLLK